MPPKSRKGGVIYSIHDHINNMMENPHFDLTDDEFIVTPEQNPLLKRTAEQTHRPDRWLLSILKDPKNWAITAKYVFNVETAPLQNCILEVLHSKSFPMLIGSRGMGKTFILGLFCGIECLFHQGTKIVVCGSAFRQSKFVIDYLNTIWENAPVFRSFCEGYGGSQGLSKETDRLTFRVGSSTAIAIPIGDGSKIRGLRASRLIAEEFASISSDVYEQVIRGFTSVSLTPMENVKKIARAKRIKNMGQEVPKEMMDIQTNQTIISGTPSFQFNHFFSYFQSYKKIIDTQGDPKKIAELFGGVIPKNFDWTQYSIIRIPYDFIPEGFMDEQQIQNSKMTLSSSLFNQEYGAVFSGDTDGFFRASLLEQATVREPIMIGNEMVQFSAMVRGNPDCKYVMGIDPAFQQDRFAVVVLECHPTHRRIVYCWTTHKKDHRARLKAHLTKEHDYFRFCARKVLDLCRMFNISNDPPGIGIDTQGGGYSIIEALHDKTILHDGELPIWIVDTGKKDQMEDLQQGLHIVEQIQFSSSEWTTTSNHNMKKDFESRTLLFPYIDAISLAMAAEDDQQKERNWDTLEDCVMEIEELRKELITIIHFETATGRERWDTSDVNLTGKVQSKNRLRKDRYSALLIANHLGRRFQHQLAQPNYTATGGFITGFGKRTNPSEPWVAAPSWFQQSDYAKRYRKQG